MERIFTQFVLSLHGQRRVDLGRKVHPIGFRLGIVKDHKSRWFAIGRKYTDQLAEDRVIRKTVQTDLPKAGISNIEIERQPNQVHVIIDTARPGVIIHRQYTAVKIFLYLVKFLGGHMNVIAVEM